jgi:hypothetical protein
VDSVPVNDHGARRLEVRLVVLRDLFSFVQLNVASAVQFACDRFPRRLAQCPDFAFDVLPDATHARVKSSFAFPPNVAEAFLELTSPKVHSTGANPQVGWTANVLRRSGNSPNDQSPLTSLHETAGPTSGRP